MPCCYRKGVGIPKIAKMFLLLRRKFKMRQLTSDGICQNVSLICSKRILFLMDLLFKMIQRKSIFFKSFNVMVKKIFDQLRNAFDILERYFINRFQSVKILVEQIPYNPYIQPEIIDRITRKCIGFVV